MNLPHEVTSWIAFAVRFLFVVVPPGVLIWRLLSTIAAHSICLSGQRIPYEARARIQYRFSIQNNEDVPITGKRMLVIQILDAAGRFSESELPTVYAGCNVIRTGVDAGFKVWSMTFDELPAYETWTIECVANQHSRNISVLIQESKPEESKVIDTKEKSPSVEGRSSNAMLAGSPRLSHSRLNLPADQNSVFEGRRTTPEAWWATFAVILALGAYGSAIYVFVYRKYGSLTYEDWTAFASIGLFGFALWWLTRRPAPSISQGYWTASRAPRDVNEQSDTMI